MFRLITSEHVRLWGDGTQKHMADLLLGGDVRDGPEAVVLGEGVAVEQQPLRQAQLAALGPVGGLRVQLSHVLVGEDEVIPCAVHVPCHLRGHTRTHMSG